ncbi:MAG: BON domain-containing protein [Pseudomonadota bacterium]
MRLLQILSLVILLICLEGCGSSRSLGASFGDANSGQDFKARLMTDGPYDYDDIDITVFEGRLMLTGTAPDEQTRQRLVMQGWQSKGVKQIIDEVVIGEKTRFKQGVADSRIDTAIRTKLITDGAIRSSDVKITVSNGVAYLIGVARDDRILTKIVDHARTTRGVTKVVSHIIFIDEQVRRL